MNVLKQNQSRTTKSIRNARIALFFSILLLILGFFSRRIFIECLGTELTGLNTTATNLLGFINLAELGIGTAVSFCLYKPLEQYNYNEVNEIVSVQGWLYRRVAVAVAVGAIILMAFFPLIFDDIDFPLWYAYGSFGVYLLGALLGYYFNYKQIVLIANQDEYKVTYCIQGVRSIKIIIQIVGIGYLNFDYSFWILTEFVTAITTCIALNLVIKKSYKWLEPKLTLGKQLIEKHSIIISKTKQLIFHRLGAYVLKETSPLIIFAFASLTIVTIYGNYLMLAMNIIMLIGAAANGLTASIGNLVAEGDEEKIWLFYKKYMVGRFWLASIVCFCFYNLAHDFISVWIGSQYMVDNITLLMLTIFAFISTTRINDEFLSVYGLFQDIWAPIVELTLNIGLSILFGYIWGLPGIVGGVVISLLLIVCCWKPYFLFTRGFKRKIRDYIFLLIKVLFATAISITISQIIKYQFITYTINNILDWIIVAAITLVCVVVISGIVFMIVDNYFKGLIIKVIKYK